MDIFQRFWFWSKNGHFSTFFFLSNIARENVFYDIPKRKNAFLGYKNEKFKKSKHWKFSKGVTHSFGPKLAIFPTFFFGNIGLENVSYEILQGKNTFLAYKNKSFKKSKNWHFPKGVNPWVLVQKWPFFHLFFRQYRPGKRLLWYSETKKRLIRLKKREVQKVEKLTFFQTG